MTPDNLWIDVDGKQIKYQISVDPDQLDLIIASELRRCYVDTMTTWRKEKDSPQLGEALLVVLQHFMTHSEFEDWYETIKEL